MLYIWQREKKKKNEMNQKSVAQLENVQNILPTGKWMCYCKSINEGIGIIPNCQTTHLQWNNTWRLTTLHQVPVIFANQTQLRPCPTQQQDEI